MPIDKRLMPAARKAVNLPVSTVPGFASSVISAPLATGSRARTAESTRSIASGLSKLGVPPPKKMGVHAPTPYERQRLIDIRDQCIDIRALRQFAVQRVRIEIAVRALADTPRHVHVSDSGGSVLTQVEIGTAPPS